jgi:hypothetical protein
VSGRSPTPVMASARPGAACPGTVRCTACCRQRRRVDGRTEDAATSLRYRSSHWPKVGARSMGSRPASAAAISRRSSPTTPACVPRVMYFRRRLPPCQPRFTMPRQRPSGYMIVNEADYMIVNETCLTRAAYGANAHSRQPCGADSSSSRSPTGARGILVSPRLCREGINSDTQAFAQHKIISDGQDHRGCSGQGLMAFDPRHRRRFQGLPPMSDFP